MFTIIFLVLFQLSHACPPGFLPGLTEDPCYKLVHNPTTFLEAEYGCVRLGGHLASVDSAFLNAYLDNQASQQFTNAFWLGGSTLFSRGNWVWSDGQAMTYKNWASGQPINNNDAFGLSVNLTSGKWYSIPVNSSQPYICEIPATSANHKCLLGWIYSSFTNRCYKYANANDLGIIGGGFDYKSGQATCKNFSSNADLVSIRDFNENTIVSANALNTEFSSSDKGCSHTLNMDCCVQIGLYYNGITFQWTDGTPVNFTNWDNTTYQPDPHYGPSVLLEIGGNDQPGFGFYHNTWQTGQCVLAICGMASIPDYSDY